MSDSTRDNHCNLYSAHATWLHLSLDAEGFTLVELLVVVAVIALLVSILLPSLSKARQMANRTKCLTNMRGMQIAHWMYMTAWDDLFITVGLSHGGVHGNEDVAWINTLQEYYGQRLLTRSPLDNSPHWGPYPEGRSIPGAPENQRRRTSYGVNDFLVDFGNGLNPYGKPPPGFAGNWPGGDGLAYNRLSRVPNPAGTVQFLIMAFTGEFAGSDHPHVENWNGHPFPPFVAAQQVQINACGGPATDWEAVGNWGFLDGHAETRRFSEVFKDAQTNSFDPLAAQ